MYLLKGAGDRKRRGLEFIVKTRRSFMANFLTHPISGLPAALPSVTPARFSAHPDNEHSLERGVLNQKNLRQGTDDVTFVAFLHFGRH